VKLPLFNGVSFWATSPKTHSGLGGKPPNLSNTKRLRRLVFLSRIELGKISFFSPPARERNFSASDFQPRVKRLGHSREWWHGLAEWVDGSTYTIGTNRNVCAWNVGPREHRIRAPAISRMVARPAEWVGGSEQNGMCVRGTLGRLGVTPTGPRTVARIG